MLLKIGFRKKKLCEALKSHRVGLGRDPSERWSTKSKLKRNAIGELCSPHYHPFDRSDVHNYKREAALIMNIERRPPATNIHKSLTFFSHYFHSSTPNNRSSSG
jgi:hypothetical protein